jgi:hypothetical protein
LGASACRALVTVADQALARAAQPVFAKDVLTCLTTLVRLEMDDEGASLREVSGTGTQATHHR